MSIKFNRRKFVTGAALSAAGVMLGSNFVRCSSKEEADSTLSAAASPVSSASSYDLMQEVMKYQKIDSHAHVWSLDNGDPETQIDYADRLGIKTLVISCPITTISGEIGPEQFKANNDLILKSVKKFPDRFIGQITLNPMYQKESLEEIDRCVDQGMVGLKVYKQVKINDPLFYPIIEKFIDYKMIMLMHSGPGKLRIGPKYDSFQHAPNLSIPEDFVDIAKRYPEAMFQFAHTGGGLDWEYACKALKDSPNVYVDTSGTNNEENMINFALKYIGEDRLLFGCDRFYYQGVGNMISSNLSEIQREKIFFKNYNNILRKAGKNVS